MLFMSPRLAKCVENKLGLNARVLLCEATVCWYLGKQINASHALLGANAPIANRTWMNYSRSAPGGMLT